MSVEGASPRLAGEARIAYLGLGSNQGDRLSLIRQAVDRLGDSPGCRVVHRSRVYETEPVGPISQSWFLNLVAACEVHIDPFELLCVAKAIEAQLGRVAGPRWGPRPIDIDLLLYDDMVVDTEVLVLPHPRMWSRRFVLVPLLDLLERGPFRVQVEDGLRALDDGQQLVRLYEPGL